MSKPKTERNALILELRDEKGYSFSQIDKELKRRGLTGLKDPNSVKMQYHRLKKAKKPVTTTLSKQITKTPSKQRVKAESKQVYQRATYRLTREQIRDINILAAKREVQRSALVRQIISGYLSTKVICKLVGNYKNS